MIEFRGWPKTPRLNRDTIITEKIDGTNAAVIVLNPIEIDGGHQLGADELTPDGVGIVVNLDEATDGWRPMIVAAQSRKRLISPGKRTDNAGFAAWVRQNAQGLAETLGEGWHYGEWWGAQNARKALQEGEKKLSLFNVGRWQGVDLSAVPGLQTVPILYEGPFCQEAIRDCIEDLRDNGSVAHPGIPAEGVIVFHKAAGHTYKVLIENDELPKGVVPRQEREATS